MSRRFLAALAGAAAASLWIPATGSAQAPVASKTVTAVGAGQSKVTPLNRKKNASIVAAIERADAKARPLAVDAARERAQELAETAGLTLGAIVSVSEAATGIFYGPFGGVYGLQGTFGPGKYCGTIRVATFKRDSTGKRVRTGTRSRQTCRVPAQSTVALTVTFAAT